MPEGPEVKVIAEFLDRFLPTKNLLSVNIDEKSKFSKSPIVKLDYLRTILPRKIVKVESYGKKIIFILEGSIFLTSSLGMEGRWSFTRGRNSNLWLSIGNEAGNFDLFYDDSRHFGNLVVSLNDEELRREFSNIGPNLLGDDISPTIWMEKFRKSRKCLAIFLLDQSIFSGIGNYLKSEICYDARINPSRKVDTLTDVEIDNLRVSTLRIMKSSYEAGGLTIHTYYHPDGKRGNYSPLVYGRKTDNFGHHVEKLKLGDGRTTFWVPELQK